MAAISKESGTERSGGWPPEPQYARSVVRLRCRTVVRLIAHLGGRFDVARTALADEATVAMPRRNGIHGASGGVPSPSCRRGAQQRAFRGAAA